VTHQKSNSTILGIVQARMGSTRLPGKVLASIVDTQTVLGIMLDRVAESKLLSDLVVATTNLTEDDEIARFCTERNVKFHRGDSADVLTRFVEASDAFNATHVVRLCADSPLHDAAIIDICIDAFLRLAGNSMQAFGSNMFRETFPYGTAVEILSRELLNQIDLQTKEETDREHVTTLLYRKPEDFECYNLELSEDYSSERWSIDTHEDLNRVRLVLEKVGPHASWLAILKATSELLITSPTLVKVSRIL